MTDHLQKIQDNLLNTAVKLSQSLTQETSGTNEYRNSVVDLQQVIQMLWQLKEYAPSCAGVE